MSPTQLSPAQILQAETLANVKAFVKDLEMQQLILKQRFDDIELVEKQALDTLD